MTPPIRRLLAALVLALATAGLLYAAVLGLSFEDTPRALADSARSERVAWASVPAAVLGALALAAARSRWSLVPLALGLGFSVLAVVLALPG